MGSNSAGVVASDTKAGLENQPGLRHLFVSDRRIFPLDLGRSHDPGLDPGGIPQAKEGLVEVDRIVGNLWR